MSSIDVRKILVALMFVSAMVIPVTQTWSQEMCEAPVWNVGDKWVFDQGTVEVVGGDEKSFTVKFSEDTLLPQEATVIFERTTFKMTHTLEGNRKQMYRAQRSSILNFPLSAGKTWKDKFMASRKGAAVGESEAQGFENFQVLGWEDVEVKAGKFKTVKLEYKQEVMAGGRTLFEVSAWYWYSPDVKYLVKWEGAKRFQFRWELVSFDLKK
jgi:hypothetical protein